MRYGMTLMHDVTRYNVEEGGSKVSEGIIVSFYCDF
jgi:hypothetical protein